MALLSGSSRIFDALLKSMFLFYVVTINLKVLTYNGFYDSNLEFVGLEGVQIVASMNSGNSLGRHKLTSRFTSIVRICSIG